jgi:hypothetical protein
MHYPDGEHKKHPMHLILKPNTNNKIHCWVTANRMIGMAFDPHKI